MLRWLPALAVPLVAFSMFGFAAVALWLPEWMASHYAFSDQEKYLAAVAQNRTAVISFLSAAVNAAGGTVLAITAFFGYRNYRIAQDKQVGDSLAKASELLGSDRTSQRLGGIVALGRLARASKEEYLSVMSILIAFARKHSTELPPGAVAQATCPDDLQMALDIVGRRYHKAEERDEYHELSDSRVAGGWFVESDFSSIYFWRAKFKACNFTRTVLSNADFTGAVFTDCVFTDADFKGAHLSGARFENSEDLTQSQLNSSAGDANTVIPESLRRPGHWTASVRPVPAGSSPKRVRKTG